MPTYEYHCKVCGHSFEKVMTFREHERLKHGSPEASPRTLEPACPKCHSHDTAQDLSAFQAVTSKKS